MTQHALDLTSELLRGMRLSGVNYRRIETSRPFGVEFGFVPAKRSFTLSAGDQYCCAWSAASA
jgi:hypothetical protein